MQVRSDRFGHGVPIPAVFALDVDTLDLPAKFTAADVFRAMHGHVLTEAAEYGTYTLNR